MADREITLNVNNKQITRTISVRLLLSDFLRDTLHLKGTHVGCEHGVCGTCTVLLNGKGTRSCLMFAVQADGCEMTTVEGLGTLTNPHPLQSAFRDHQALQCGFCTSGMLLTAFELLKAKSNPTREEVRDALSGNLCRCTGYESIVDAVLAAAEECSGG